MTKFADINEKTLLAGDIIKLDHTVNGFNTFVVLCLEPLEIKYCDCRSGIETVEIHRDYEYDKLALLSNNPLTGEVDFEIIGNINNPDINVKWFQETTEMVVENVATIEVPETKGVIRIIDGDAAMEFILRHLYEIELGIFDGVKKHPDGLTFDDWMNKNKLFLYI